MLIKIQNIEGECGDLEDEVDDLKRRINRLLKEHDQEKDNQKGSHEDVVDDFATKNQKLMSDLKK